MSQAITTKYLPATNNRCSRIKATCDAGSLTISYPHELSGQAVHRKAAEALAAKCWPAKTGKLLGGSLPGNAGCCFIFDDDWARD